MSYHVLTYRPPKAHQRPRKWQFTNPLPRPLEPNNSPDAAAQMALGYAIATTLSNLPSPPSPSSSDSCAPSDSSDSSSSSSSGSGSSSSD
jgi:hypothetical protein